MWIKIKEQFSRVYSSIVDNNIPKTLFFVFVMGGAGISMTLFLKWVFLNKNDQFPFTFISIQCAINVLVAGIMCKLWNLYINHQIINWNLFKKLIPIGILTGFDYGLSNLSLVFVTVTVYTIVKSVVPLFIMIISFITGVLKPKLSLILSVVFITIGIMLTLFGFTQVNILGVFFIALAAGCAAIRLVGLQKVLQSTDIIPRKLLTDEDFERSDDEVLELHLEPTHVPSLLVYCYVSGVISLTLLPLAAIFEFRDIYVKFSDYKLVDHSDLYSKIFFMMRFFSIAIVGGTIGLILNVSEYFVIQLTSSLTLSIIGIIRELLLIALGMLLFGDKMTIVNSIGYVICLCGIIVYKVDRYIQLNKVDPPRAHTDLKNLIESDDENDIELENESLILYEKQAQEKKEKEASIE
jgi:solute carrier family 35 protein C2